MAYFNDKKKIKIRVSDKIMLKTGSDSIREKTNSLQIERINPLPEKIKEKYS